MLYIITLVVMFVWMVTLICKRQISWHSIIAAYSIAVFTADLFEVTLNLLMDFYKFPTHLRSNPIDENELGIIFSDTIILPFTFIVFIYYASKTKRPWKTSLSFAIGFIILELIYLKFGYLKYINWNLAFSAAFYVTGFRFGAYLAPRISNYDPPVPYRFRLLCFSHMIIMWVGALFASPVLKMYQFRPAVFNDPMADCRFTDLLSGDVLSILITLLIPLTPKRLKPVVFAAIACIGLAFAFFTYHKGWLLYHNWNHYLTILRYIVPIALIMLYDHWETSYRINPASGN
jgi:hypothetical protein